MQSIGTAVAITNPFNQSETFDITFAVPSEELSNPLSNQSHTITMDVFGVPETMVINSSDFRNPGKPITEEGNIMIALDNQLYEKWVQGGRKGTGFTEVKSPNMSANGVNNNNINAHAPIVVSDRKMFEITGNTATFENITLQPNETRTTSMMVLYPTNPISDKQEFKYDIIQKRTDNGKIIGRSSL